MSAGALEGERMLTQMVPPLVNLQYTESAWPGQNGWEAGSSDILMYETYFDTSGYALSDLTLFPVAATLQDPGTYSFSNPALSMQVVEMICSERLTHTEAYAWITGNTMPGMDGTTMDFHQIQWGQYRLFLLNSTLNIPIALAQSQTPFGSGAPTTAEKVWCYRFIVVDGSQEGDTLSVPASRFVLSAVIAKESELSFIMRQKRSYELAS